MKDSTFHSAAYGGEGWSPRKSTLREELGSIWTRCGLSSEYSPLRSVLLHRPGAELLGGGNPVLLQMLSFPDLEAAAHEHDQLAGIYEANQVKVHYVGNRKGALPNQMFMADLIFMTPEGAIVGRPASTVRAGEELVALRSLAELGIPILGTIGGAGTFEAADAMWITEDLVLLGRGLRSNSEGLDQVDLLLRRLAVRSFRADLPWGTMHLMGQLRLVADNLAFAWHGRLACSVVELLRETGYCVRFPPPEAETELSSGMALNFVTLAPNRILMPAGNPVSQAFYESFGVDCQTARVMELSKAAGAIGCLTAILERESTGSPTQASGR